MKTYNDNDHNNHEFEGGGGGGRGRGGGGDEGEEEGGLLLLFWRLAAAAAAAGETERQSAERLEVLVTAGGSASKSPLPSASPTFPSPLSPLASPRLALPAAHVQS